MATNYARGRTHEYAIVKHLKEIGFHTVFRSAGSHSPVDVVAISNQQILFIQAKPAYVNPKDFRQAMEFARKVPGRNAGLNAFPLVSVQLWQKQKRGWKRTLL